MSGAKLSADITDWATLQQEWSQLNDKAGVKQWASGGLKLFQKPISSKIWFLVCGILTASTISLHA